MAIYTMETEMFKSLYASPEMKSIFEEENYLQTMIDFEVALAEAQAGLGMIPAKAADEIKKKGCVKYVSLKRVGEINNEIQLFTVAVVRAFKEACEGGAGEYIHYGATSQDMIETSLACRVREALDITEKKLKDLLKTLVCIAEKHKNTLIAARSHGQQALPSTFGFIVAGYADMVYLNIERLREARKRILVGSCTGAVGTSSSFYAIAGEKVVNLEKLVMDKLNLGTPVISQQPNIAKFSELLNLLGLIAQTFEKIGEDLYTMQRTEIAEVAEHFDIENQICSSTMPQKRNPIHAEMMPPFAKKIISNAQAMMSSHHRDARHFTPFYMYDLLIPESFLLTDTIINAAQYFFGGIQVNENKMKETLYLTRGLLTSEALLFALAKMTDKKETAMAIVHRVAMYSFEANVSFIDACTADKEIAQYFSKEEIIKILDPENYIGIATKIIDDVINQCQKIILT
jgi:adenylosuccinate lyase